MTCWLRNLYRMSPAILLSVPLQTAKLKNRPMAKMTIMSFVGHVASTSLVFMPSTKHPMR